MLRLKEEHIMGFESIIFIGLCMFLLISFNDKSDHRDNSPGLQNQITVSLTSVTIISEIHPRKNHQIDNRQLRFTFLPSFKGENL